MKNQSMGLMHAVISSANLEGADLRGADLSRADLSFTSLAGADLHGARIFGGDFSGTSLAKADLSGADLRESTFIDTDFNVVMTNAAQFGYAVKGVEPVWRPRPLFNGRIAYMTAATPESPLRLAQADWGYIRTSPSSLADGESLPYEGGAQRYFGPDRDADHHAPEATEQHCEARALEELP